MHILLILLAIGFFCNGGALVVPPLLVIGAFIMLAIYIPKAAIWMVSFAVLVLVLAGLVAGILIGIEYIFNKFFRGY